jgi:hypothetical protein
LGKITLIDLKVKLKEIKTQKKKGSNLKPKEIKIRRKIIFQGKMK